MTEKKYEENSAPQKATSYPNHNPTLTLILTLTQNGLVGTPRIWRLAPSLFVLDYGNRQDSVSIECVHRSDDTVRDCQTSPSRSSPYRRGDEFRPPSQAVGALCSPLTGAGGGGVAAWSKGRSDLFIGLRLFSEVAPYFMLVNFFYRQHAPQLLTIKCFHFDKFVFTTTL